MSKTNSKQKLQLRFSKRKLSSQDNGIDDFPIEINSQIDEVLQFGMSSQPVGLEKDNKSEHLSEFAFTEEIMNEILRQEGKFS